MNQMSVLVRFAIMAIALVLLARPAAADPLDGRWCTFDGQRMSIDGQRIITPGGARMTGEYDHGSLVYGVRGYEPGTGFLVSLTPLDQESLRLVTNRRDVKPEIWHRCGPPMI